MMGLLQWHETPQPRWYDQDEKFVDEAEIWERFRDQVVARWGVRAFVDDGVLADLGIVDVAPVRLESDVTFAVADEAAAKAHVDADPEGTHRRVCGRGVAGDPQGGIAHLRAAAHHSSAYRWRPVPHRFLDPSHWGIPGVHDRIDGPHGHLEPAHGGGRARGLRLHAGRASGEPASGRRWGLRPQGTGFGGMTSMHRLYVDRFKGEPITRRTSCRRPCHNVVAAPHDYRATSAAMVS